MKAIVVDQFGPIEHMSYRDVNIPAFGPKQLLIKVVITSINFADIKARHGGKGASTPYIPGLEAAGIVAQTGEEVSEFRVGQRVLAFPQQGTYAEYAVADEALTFALPEAVTFEMAAASGIVGFLSWKLLADVACMKKGENVLIYAAAGGVGGASIQIAKSLGAASVIGIVGDDSKKKAAEDAGADQVLVYRGEDFSAQVKEWTQGRGADIILDSVGGELTTLSMGCLARFGRLVAFGNSSGQYGQISTAELHASCRSVLGFSLGTTRKEQPETLRDTAHHVFRLLQSGQLQVQIRQKLPLADAALGHQLVESRQSTGKLLLQVSGC